MITYEVIDICPLIHPYSHGPRAINDKGFVVGSTDVNGLGQAFRFYGSTLKFLTPLSRGEASGAWDINNSDIIVGQSGNAACKWVNLAPKPLPGGDAARTINDAQVIGGSASYFNPVKWVNDQPQALDQMGGIFPFDYPCRVTASDNKGRLFGYFGEFSNHYSACRWETTGRLSPLDLANYTPFGPGHRHTRINGANRSGLAVGHVEQPGGVDVRAYYWADGKEGTLPSTPAIAFSDAFDANSSGQIVGRTFANGQSRATIWTGDVITDLNNLIDPSSGWVLESATCINDSAEIAGTGTYLGAPHAYLLRHHVEVRRLKIPHMVWHVLAGVRGDGPGIVIGPNGKVIKVPPWNPLIKDVNIGPRELKLILGLSQRSQSQKR